MKKTDVYEGDRQEVLNGYRRLDASLFLSMELFYQELGYKHSLRVLANVAV